MFTYTLLDLKQQPYAAGNSLRDMMTIMANRWGGRVIHTRTGTVLFDIKTDRITEKERPTAAERRAEYALAESRNPEYQEQAQ